jgi:hypothetical protein
MRYQPVPDDALLWRYMELAKYKAFIGTNSLYCPRAARFEDPWESRLPRAEEEAYMNDMLAHLAEMGMIDDPNPTAIDGVRSNFKKWDLSFDRNRFVSCWHINEAESAAMWDLYCKRDAGVAVVSTGPALKYLAHLNREQGAIFAAVEYLDYEKDSIRESRDALFCKRRSFAHEQEARLVCFPKWEMVSSSEIKFKDFLMLPLDLDVFINRILISPTADESFKDEVLWVSDLFKLKAPITQSDLYSPY